jgi:hypothetical protein
VEVEEVPTSPSLDKAAPNGVATLDSNGKIPSSQLSALAINNTYVVSSEVDMLALSANTGDVAVRTDENKTYILSSGSPNILANWVEVLTPANVISVNGQTGIVDLTTSNVTEGLNKYFSTTNIQDYFAGLSGYANARILRTDGAGGFYWAIDQTGGGGGGSLGIGDAIGGAFNNEVLYVNGSGTLQQSSNFVFDDTTDNFVVGHNSGGRLVINPTTGYYSIGDNNGIDNSTNFVVNDSSKYIQASTDGRFLVSAAIGGTTVFDADILNRNIKIGDANSLFSGTLLTVNDLIQNINLDSKNISLRAQDTIFYNKVSGQPVFRLTDNASYIIATLGDVDSALNGTRLIVNDSGKTIYAHTDSLFDIRNVAGTSSFFRADIPNRKIISGDVFSNFNKTNFTVDDTSQRIYANGSVHGASGVGLNLDFANNTYELGQVSGGTGNHTKISIDDDLSKIIASARVNDVQDSAGHLLIHSEDITGPIVELGDLSDSANGTKLTVDDSSKSIINTTSQNFGVADLAGNYFLSTNTTSRTFAGGDVGGSFNKTRIIVNDTNKYIQNATDDNFTVTNSNGSRFILGDIFDKTIKLGDIDSIGNHTQLTVDDINKKVILASNNTKFVVDGSGSLSVPGSIFNQVSGMWFVSTESDTLNQWLYANPTDRTVIIGNRNGAYNGTRIDLDDNTKKITFRFGLGSGDSYSLPAGDGSTNYLLATNGSGQLFWQDPTLVPSDRSLKSNIAPISYGLDTLMQLNPVSYTLNSNGKEQVGFIAQDVESLIPELVGDVANGKKGVAYGQMTAVIVKSVQELDLKITDIENFASAENKTFLDNLIAWLGNEANGIGDLFAGRVNTHELCVDGECLNQDDVRQLIELKNSVNTGNGTVPPAPVAPDPVPAPQDIVPPSDPVTPQPDPAPEVVPDPVIPEPVAPDPTVPDPTTSQ